MGKKLKLENHHLAVKHLKLSEAEKKKLFEKYHVALKELPKILKTDPAIMDLNVEVGDIVKVLRKSPTAGEIIYYRGVVND